MIALRSRLSSAVDPVVDVVGHVFVDVVGQLDEAERLAQVLLHPPREIARVDRQAVAADAGAGRELHVPERLGGGGVDRPPHVDVEVAGEHRQLVDQGDVDVAERVLQQLDQLGLGAGTDRHRGVDERGEERVDDGERVGRVAADHLGGVDQAVGGVARVDPLGGVAEEEVARLVGRCGPETRPLGEDRAEERGGGAGIGGALEDHAGAGSEVLADGGAGLLDVAEVGFAVAQRRRHAR